MPDTGDCAISLRGRLKLLFKGLHGRPYTGDLLAPTIGVLQIASVALDEKRQEGG